MGASGSTFNSTADLTIIGPSHAGATFGFTLANIAVRTPPEMFVAGATFWTSSTGRAYIYDADVPWLLLGTIDGVAPGDLFTKGVAGGH